MAVYNPSVKSECIEQQSTRNSISIIWFNADLNGNELGTNSLYEQIKTIFPDVHLIQESKECVRFLKENTRMKCFLIISDSSARDLVPKIHDLAHLDSIFVVCDNKSCDESWSEQWKKIQGIHTTVVSICSTLKIITRQAKQDEIVPSFLSGTEITSKADLKRLEPSFMYSSMIKDILLDMNFNRTHVDKMIKSFLEKYKGQTGELVIIKEFDKDYRSDTAIWWYTRECFTYRQVNAALRNLEADIFIDMGFFIRDIHRQLEQLHMQQIRSFENKSFILYRGQGMLAEHFNKLKENKGGLMGFNCFLSTSRDITVSLEFAARGSQHDGHVGTLFIMSIDPTLHSVPFADITEHSFFREESEILFSMHTIFKIGDIKPHSSSKSVYEISLELTSEDDPNLKILKKHMAAEQGTHHEHRLGLTLLEMGQYKKAEEIYLDLSKRITNEQDKALWNHQLGCIKDEQGKYDEALQFYQQALEIRIRILPQYDTFIATTYNQIGLVHNEMGNYSKALTNYDKMLEIYKKTLPENHSSLAISYNNIGLVYLNMEDYPKALKNYEKSLAIYTKTLPNNHPDLATSYNNVGLVYANMGDHHKALINYEKSLEIRVKVLPGTHPDLAQSYNNIGLVYKKMKNYPKALNYHEKSIEILKKTVDENHPHMATSYHNLGTLLYQMKKYSAALENLEKARRIFMIALPPTHPDLKTVNKWIDDVKKAMK